MIRCNILLELIQQFVDRSSEENQVILSKIDELGKVNSMTLEEFQEYQISLIEFSDEEFQFEENDFEEL
jgi:hypothetical protein